MMARVFDPYLIPGTNVLRNLVGATDEDALAAAENDLCSARAAILRENLPPAEGTLEQLRRIHRFLFRDVYDWAGEVRTIDMGKGEGLPFQPLELFSIGVRYSEGVLRADDLLKGLGHDEFVKRLSVSYNNFNILHPFREGNGRTQRIFWEIIAREAGWHFDWGLIDKRTNDQASIAGMQRNDLRPLEDMFRRIVKPLSEPVNMRNRRTRHTTCLSSSAVTCTSITPTSAPSSPRGKESRNAGTRQDDFRMRRARIHYLGIWFSVFCSFSIPVFRFFGIHRFRYPVG